MVAAIGNFPKARLLEEFARMAKDQNECHEHNKGEQGTYKHDSGWGVVYKVDLGYKLYKAPVPCWSDPEFTRIGKRQIFLIHARKASPGYGSNLVNTHPFQKQRKGTTWYFCHNGTINDSVLPHCENLEGETDSERFFNLLLERYDESNDMKSLATTIRSFNNYTSLNFLLSNGKFLYAACCYQKYPRYYTLKLHQDDKYLIVSSERLGRLTTGWEAIENGLILKVDVSNPRNIVSHAINE